MHFEAGARSERSGFFFVGKQAVCFPGTEFRRQAGSGTGRKTEIIRKLGLILIIIIKNRNFLMTERNEGRLHKGKVIFHKNIIDD